MRSSITYKERIIDFDIEYRNRRTMAIYIRPPGKIIVLSPEGISERIIQQRVMAKGRWILKKISELEVLDPEGFKKTFTGGESFLFLGEGYGLKVISNGRKIPVVFFSKGVFYLETGIFETSKSRKAMEKWYRKKADQIINERVEHFINKIGKRPGSVKVKEQKRRWGSCTTRGDLYFNWRIIMAPPGIIDYVVVHELTHLICPDHSRRFWQKVESVLPDYKKRRKWLKVNGLKLDI